MGKSSLLNALLEEERAIVTHLPGTTRDTIEEIINIRGIPVRIIDTAGIVEPKDLLQKKAVSKSKRYFKEADIILLVLDGSKPAKPEDKRLLKKIKGRNAIVVINKLDLKQRLDTSDLNGFAIQKVSALKREGMDNLKEAIADIVLNGKISLENFSLLSNARHTGLIEEALLAISNARDSLRNEQFPLEFVAFDLRRSLDYLGMILGENFSEELLESIFSQFCIGK